MDKQVLMNNLQDIKTYSEKANFNLEHIAELKKSFKEEPKTYYKLVFITIFIVSIIFHNMSIKSINVFLDTNFNIYSNGILFGVAGMALFSFIITFLISTALKPRIYKSRNEVDEKNTSIYDGIADYVGLNHQLLSECKDKYPWYPYNFFDIGTINFLINQLNYRNVDTMEQLMDVYEEHMHKLRLEQIEIEKLELLKRQTELQINQAEIDKKTIEQQQDEVKKLRKEINKLRWKI